MVEISLCCFKFNYIFSAKWVYLIPIDMVYLIKEPNKLVDQLVNYTCQLGKSHLESYYFILVASLKFIKAFRYDQNNTVMRHRLSC